MRTRLSLAIGTVIVVTLVLFSVIVVRDTRVALTDQVDAQVLDFAKHTTGKQGNGDKSPDATRGKPADEATPAAGGAIPAATAGPLPNDAGAGRQEIARFVYDPSGGLILQEPSGYRDNPDAPPNLPRIPGSDLNAILGRIVTLPATGDAFNYRVLVQQLPDGDYNVSAASLANVDDAIANMARFLLLAGAAAVLIAVLASWLLIRRGLKPVDRMVDTATAIAAGDLSRRVPDPHPHTELGRLGGALNEMLTRIEQAMQVQAASEERLRRFVADAAHELRTPLTSLRGYAELYRQGALPTEAGVARAMGRIESEGGRMAHLVEDLLLLARLDRQRDLERKAVDISSLVTDAVGDFRVAQPERTVTSQIEPDLIVVGDRLRLRQIFDNLLSNARTHTPVESPVNVSVAQVEGQIRIEVVDRGPGISKEDQARIFERFWRADPARSRSGGSGLGLSIAASLVEAQDGVIEVESEIGRGATFVISFPVAATDDLSPPVEGAESR